MTQTKPFDRQLRPSTNSLPARGNCGLGTREYDARRAEAEYGSARLAAAIRKHHPERAA